MNIFDLFDKISPKKRKGGPIKKIIVGLGNPGPKYDNTRHNAGFKALDAVAQKFNIVVDKYKFKAFVGDGFIENTRCLLVKPLTYMNESGVSVEAAREYYKLDVSDIIVLVDDISFDLGKIRIRRKGSAGTHNGLKSVIYSTGDENFCRIKIGVGNKPNPEYDLARWVLARLKGEDLEKLEAASEKIAQAIGLVVCGKIDEAMNKYN